MSEPADREKRLSILSGSEIEELEKNVRFLETSRGTRLAFHEYGDPGGDPIIFYHGTGSHVHGMLLHKPGIEYGFRIIAPDRPGVARSDFRPGWTVLDYARDMADLADRLGIGSFGAIGISGGGPTLMASAFAIPDRLRYVVDLACAMPVYADPEMVRNLGNMDRLYARLGTRLPLALFRIPFSVLGMTQKVVKRPGTFARMFDSSLCPADKEIFRMSEFQYLLMRDFQELFRNGSAGPAYDAQTVYKDWGFRLSDIDIHIEVFQGTADLFIPPRFSEYLAEHAKDVRINRIEGEGHFHHIVHGYRMLKKVKDLFCVETQAGKD
ncbi:MAG: alpha/beta hydrolase [Syntrophaceae bacterium]|nr:alpha/beta hydrolase [Syntrophaceae bacterium]